MTTILWQQLKMNFKQNRMSLEATKNMTLKRKVGYGKKTNEIDEEEKARSEK
jgi:hypothetical protein